MSLAEKGRIMRKLSVAVATLLVSTLALTACGSEAGDGDTTSLVVGASPVPHARILEFVRDNLAAEAGIELEIREFDDYVTPNTAVEDGSIDANYFQHVPYFDNFTEEHGYDFERGEGIHIEPFAAFSDQHDSVADVPDGATVAITNDPSNQFRALKVLEAAGLLENVADDATVLTLTDEENTRGLQFEENQPEVIVQLLGDPAVDIAMINGNFILTAGLSAEEAIAIEEVEGNPYANVLAWKAGSEKTDAITQLDELLHSEEVADFIRQEWPSGDVIPG